MRDQSVVSVALRDRRRWEVLPPWVGWPIMTPRSRSAVDAFLEFFDSPAALRNQILWLAEASWGHWNADRSDFPEYGDRSWLFQQAMPDDDSAANIVAERASEAFHSLIEANALGMAMKKMKTKKPGYRRQGLDTPSPNNVWSHSKHFFDLSLAERGIGETVEQARHMARKIDDNWDFAFLPVARDRHDVDGPVVEISRRGSVISVLYLDEDWTWQAAVGGRSRKLVHEVEKQVTEGLRDVYNPWAYRDSPFTFLVQVFGAFRPAGTPDVWSEWDQSALPSEIWTLTREWEKVESWKLSTDALAAMKLAEWVRPPKFRSEWDNEY